MHTVGIPWPTEPMSSPMRDAPGEFTMPITDGSIFSTFAYRSSSLSFPPVTNFPMSRYVHGTLGWLKKYLLPISNRFLDTVPPFLVL